MIPYNFLSENYSEVDFDSGAPIIEDHQDQIRWWLTQNTDFQEAATTLLWARSLQEIRADEDLFLLAHRIKPKFSAKQYEATWGELRRQGFE